MRLFVRHETRYTYSSGGSLAVQRLRLTPRDTAAQTVIDWRIEAPGIGEAATYTDGLGNVVHLIAAETAADRMAVVATGAVDTRETHGVLGDTGERAHPAVFLRTTPLTTPTNAIVALAREAVAADPLDQLHRLMESIADRVSYVPDTTVSSTSAGEAFEAGQGVCQDHAHILIAAARSLGLPARYVTGYMLTDNRPADPHAWAEIHTVALGWVGFDAANRLCPTEGYVRLASGFDAPSAAPITGRRVGGGEETLAVAVAVGQSQTQSQGSNQSQSQG